MPNAMGRVALVQVFTWFAWFCFNTLNTAWWGHDIMHGDASAASGTPAAVLYSKGLQYGGRAGAIQAGVQLIASLLLLKWIIPRFGIKGSYFGCLIATCACFFGAFFSWSMENPTPQLNIDGAFASVGLSGIGLAATNIMPFTLGAQTAV